MNSINGTSGWVIAPMSKEISGQALVVIKFTTASKHKVRETVDVIWHDKISC